MSVSQMATSRLYKLVQILCSARNANLPVEQGKCLEPIENGVELHHAHFLLDSQHSEYTSPIAKFYLILRLSFGAFMFLPLAQRDSMDSLQKVAA